MKLVVIYSSDYLFSKYNSLILFIDAIDFINYRIHFDRDSINFSIYRISLLYFESEYRYISLRILDYKLNFELFNRILGTKHVQVK